MIKSYKEFNNINEGLSYKQNKLRDLLMLSINKIDENLSVKDFAAAVSDIFYAEYGQHNYSEFIRVWNNVKAMHIDDLEED